MFIEKLSQKQIKEFLTNFQMQGENKICNDVDSLSEAIFESIRENEYFDISFSNSYEEDYSLTMEDFGICSDDEWMDNITYQFEEAWVKFLHNEFGMDYYIEFYNANQIALDAMYV